MVVKAVYSPPRRGSVLCRSLHSRLALSRSVFIPLQEPTRTTHHKFDPSNTNAELNYSQIYSSYRAYARTVLVINTNHSMMK